MSAYASEPRRVPEQPCPACGHTLDALTQADAEATEPPEPGDQTVCFRCTTILVFGPLGALRVADPREISAQALKVQADLQAFHLRFPQGGEAP